MWKSSESLANKRYIAIAIASSEQTDSMPTIEVVLYMTCRLQTGTVTRPPHRFLKGYVHGYEIDT